MKNHLLAMLLLFFLQPLTFAQYWNGTYQTNFGPVKLITENGIVYGDYAGNGTILAYEYAPPGSSKTQLHGVFFNGDKIGKFIWKDMSYSNSTAIKVEGYYAFDAAITLDKVKQAGMYFESTHFPNLSAESKWTGNRTSTANPNDLQSAVWTGKWSTSFGELDLQQIGRTVMGKYSDVGNIDGVYDKKTKTWKGNFSNKGKIGFFEFVIEGNTFKGKWGWNSKLTEGVWSGTKSMKTNAAAEVSSTPTTNAITLPPLKKADDVIYQCQLDYLDGGYWEDVYGIGWIRLYIKDKVSKEMKMVQPHMFTYLDKFGRVFEIPKSKSINSGLITLMNEPIRFKFNPNEYGYNSLEEMKGEAYFEFGFEVKLNGYFSDDIVGKKFVKTFIEDANIRRLQISETLLSSPQPGFFKLQKDDYDFGVYYSIKKL